MTTRGVWVGTWVLALIVAACGGAKGKGGSGSTTGTGGDMTSGSGGSASNLELVDDALDGECPTGSKKPGTGVGPGNDLYKVTLSDYPEAVCNDGSPGIMYVRRAATPAAENDWVIFLQFGGSCTDWKVCRDRWCSYETGYDAAKMSSRFAPEGTNGAGILLRDPSNTFGNANQVIVYYCSSDQWLGRKSDVELESTLEGEPSFRLHFRGFSIVEAVNDALAKGVKSDNGKVTMPKLTDAKRIVFAGGSAGSAGQTNAIDWWAAKYPGADSVGLFDATVDPLPEDVADPALAKAYADVLPVRFQEVFRNLYDAHLDESCVAAHPGADAHLCTNWSHLRLNHVTTPYFLRHDLSDPVVFTGFKKLGFTLAELAQATKKTLDRHKTVLSEAEEKKAMKRNPGIHASNCGQHIVALNSGWFGVTGNPHTVEDGGGMPISIHDAFASWAEGNTVQAIDTQPSTKSKCLMTNDDQ
jgi:hypothetical protein